MKPPATRTLPLEIDSWYAEFCSDKTERAFLAHHLLTTQAQLRVAFLFCASIYLAFAVTDLIWIGWGAKAALLLCTRALVLACALTSLALLKRFPRSIALTRMAACATEITGVLSFLLVAALRPDEFSLHAISMAIIIIVYYIYIPNRTVYAAAIALPATAGFIALAAWLGQLRPVELGTVATLLVMANLFGFVAVRRYQLLWREEFSAQNRAQEPVRARPADRLLQPPPPARTTAGNGDLPRPALQAEPERHHVRPRPLQAGQR